MDQLPVKKVWESKTVWINLLMALVAFYPPAHEWIYANPSLVGVVFGVINMALRLISKGKIELV